MTVDLRLLVVVAKLNDDIITWAHFLQHPIPSTFVDEGEGGTSIDGMIVDADVLGVKALLEHHAPSTLLLAPCGVFVGHGGIANREDGGDMLIGG